MVSQFEPGDVVTVKDPGSGRPFHTCLGNSYTQETWIGATGTLEKIVKHQGASVSSPVWSIVWDQSEIPPKGTDARDRANRTGRVKTSWIDESCLELAVDMKYVLNSLKGITPHCNTCSCFKEEG